MASNYIVIKGAKEHNLKNISVTIPRNKLTVITGPSGSGKSTLAFDIIYAEGQRRYVESLSAYARQFLERMDKPDVEYIDGLSPSIAIEQKTTSKNPRSTVGTVTEIYDYLRLLYARTGHPFCYQCGREIKAQSIDQIVDTLLKLPEKTRVIIMAPVVADKKGSHEKLLDRLRRDGYVRTRIDGQIVNLDEDPRLEKNKKHTIEVIVDRVVIRNDIGRRLADSLGMASRLSQGLLTVQLNGERELLFSQTQACIFCNISLPELTPQLFSFNSPQGACPACGGLGTNRFVDPELIVPNPESSLREGAIMPWAQKHGLYRIQMLQALADHFNFDLYTPFKDLPDRIKEILLFGSKAEEVDFSYEKSGRKLSCKQPFEGVIPQLERRYRETTSSAMREDIEQFMNQQPCRDCGGTRLRKEARSVRVGLWTIDEFCNLTISDAATALDGLDLSRMEQTIAEPIIREVKSRLSYMKEVGLDYLNLNRPAASLSGGEGQRIRLATQIGSRLAGVIYVLDEPSIGLHQRDHGRLMKTLLELRDAGNTVLVVEHDPDTIRSADYVVDMGPAAGQLGGEVVFSGTPLGLLSEKRSITGQFLAGVRCIPVPRKRRMASRGNLKLIGASENNLKNISLEIPVGLMVCVTGVSGSGKSSLVIDTLYRYMAHRLYRAKEHPGRLAGIEGTELFDKVIDVDQSPIGRTPRSNPATYTGLFAPIRDLYAKMPEARMRGYKSGRFSFNIKGGRCETCNGDGLIRIEMQFLPDVYVPCEECRGSRYNRETLDIKYKGKNIAEVLELTVEEAYQFFENIPVIKGKLKMLRDVGLGYIRLGQPATTLSGGEAQRIKLAKELSRRATGKTMYILDEPTTGLHPADIHTLLEVLNKLVKLGNTVIIIEHNLDVIKSADFIIDLGPEGGKDGGYIVAAGTPEEICEIEGSYTGQYLRKVLGGCPITGIVAREVEDGPKYSRI